MKEGRTLQEVAEQVQKDRDAKFDVRATTNLLGAEMDNNRPTLFINAEGEIKSFGMTPHFQTQVAGHYKIPSPYRNLMDTEGASDLLMHNFNYWFKKKPSKHLVRCLSGNARAFLGPNYQIRDNHELVERVFPMVEEYSKKYGDGIRVASCEVNERKIYMKFLFPKIAGEVKEGDPVQAGVCISNSEIGLSSIAVEPFVYRLVCRNGMISADRSMRKRHTGRRTDDNLDYQIFEQDTIAKDNEAFWLKIRDILRSSLDEASFKHEVQILRNATEKEVKDPVASIEVISNEYQLNEDEKAGVLSALVKGGDISQYGVINAITAHSQKVEDYDRATHLERLGGKILAESDNVWSRIANATGKN